MRTYFTADQHFNCPGLVTATRPWTTPGDHDQYVLDCLNTVVGRRDRLIILGDMCKGRPYKWREKIVCRDVWFILGNHDHRAHTEKAFGKDRVRESMMIRLNSECRVYCSHYPHAHWPSSHHGVCHCYGHVHSQREVELDGFYPQRRSMDVGIDNAVKFYGSPQVFPQEFFTDVLMTRRGHDMVK